MSRMFRVLALMTVMFASPAATRADAFDSLQEALVRVVGQAIRGNLANNDYDGSGCLFGYLLNAGAEKGMTRPFQAGRTYLILGAGDNDVSDLDMWITPEGQDQVRLVQDTDPDPVPGFRFTPPWSGKFTVHINNVQSRGPSFCCFVVLVQVNRPTLAAIQMSEALDRAIALGRLRGLFAKSFPQNGLVLFGGNFFQNDASSSYDLALPADKYVAMATGSANVQDVDLFITQQFRRGDCAGLPIAKDDGNDPTTICVFQSNGNSSYDRDHRFSQLRSLPGSRGHRPADIRFDDVQP
jgi:hypothetical protein